MTRFEVDSAQVTQAGAAVQASAQQIGAEVDRMMRHLLELQAGWRGQAATSFQHVVTEWRGTQERVRTALEEIQAALAVAGRQYEEVEASTVRMFTGDGIGSGTSQTIESRWPPPAVGISTQCATGRSATAFHSDPATAADPLVAPMRFVAARSIVESVTPYRVFVFLLVSMGTPLVHLEFILVTIAGRRWATGEMNPRPRVGTQVNEGHRAHGNRR
jgi:early secretory antigenic target protein ESAT-6